MGGRRGRGGAGPVSTPAGEPPGPLSGAATAALHELFVGELRAAVQSGADPARLREAAAQLLRSNPTSVDAAGPPVDTEDR